MSWNRFKFLRILVMVLLALLIIQFELGMAVNIGNPPSLPPFSFSLARISDALHQAGGAALPHTILGTWLVIFSVLNLILSISSRVRSVQIFGALAFIATALAASTGYLFVLSGFQNDNYSHGMATNFILSFSFYFLEFYFLKPDSKAHNP